MASPRKPRAPFLGKRGADHAEALLLPDFSRAVQAHMFKNSMPSPPKAEDVFQDEGVPGIGAK